MNTITERSATSWKLKTELIIYHLERWFPMDYEGWHEGAHYFMEYEGEWITYSSVQAFCKRYFNRSLSIVIVPWGTDIKEFAAYLKEHD